jgi:hypothetical protein
MYAYSFSSAIADLAVLELQQQVEEVDRLADVLRAVLAPVPRDVLDDRAFDVAEAVGVDVLDGLDLAALVVPAADLFA